MVYTRYESHEVRCVADGCGVMVVGETDLHTPIANFLENLRKQKWQVIVEKKVYYCPGHSGSASQNIPLYKFGYQHFPAHKLRCSCCQKIVWEKIAQEKTKTQTFEEIRLEFFNRLKKTGWKYYFGPSFEVHNCAKCNTFMLHPETVITKIRRYKLNDSIERTEFYLGNIAQLEKLAKDEGLKFSDWLRKNQPNLQSKDFIYADLKTGGYVTFGYHDRSGVPFWLQNLLPKMKDEMIGNYYDKKLVFDEKIVTEDFRNQL